MTRDVSQILWEHCMDELGIDGNDYENDTFAVRSYNWVDDDANDWHFWHKPSGLKIEWYKYPLRGFEANMEITDDQFLDVLRDCTNSMEDGKKVRFLHDIHRWWDDRNCSENPNNCEDCETCRHWWESEEVCLLDDCQYEPETMYYPQVDGITPSVIKTEPQNEFEDKPYLYWDIDGYLDEVDEPQTERSEK